MKTMENFKRKSLKSAAVIVSFVLISLTVGAQTFWKELLTNNSFSGIAQAMSTSAVKESQPVSEMKTINAAWFTEYLNESIIDSFNEENWEMEEQISNLPVTPNCSYAIKPLKVDEKVVEKSDSNSELSGRIASVVKE